MNNNVDKMVANYLTVLENPNKETEFGSIARTVESAIGIYCETTAGKYVNDDLVSNYFRILSNPEIRKFISSEVTVRNMQSVVSEYINTTSKNYVDAYHASKSSPFLDAFDDKDQGMKR